jgi:hypothetical protein
MRKRKTYFAQRGDITTNNFPTRKEAKAALEPMIDYACRFRSSHIECRFGSLIIIVPNATGFDSYLIPNPGDLAHGQRVTSHSQCFAPDIESVVQSARLNAAMCAWQIGSTSDSKLGADAGLTDEKIGELNRWIRFQREYAAAISAGKTKTEAFDIATGRTGNAQPV